MFEPSPLLNFVRDVRILMVLAEITLVVVLVVGVAAAFVVGVSKGWFK